MDGQDHGSGRDARRDEPEQVPVGAPEGATAVGDASSPRGARAAAASGTDDAGTVDPVALRADTDTASGCPAVTTPSADGATRVTRKPSRSSWRSEFSTLGCS